MFPLSCPTFSLPIEALEAVHTVFQPKTQCHSANKVLAVIIDVAIEQRPYVKKENQATCLKINE